MVNLFCYQAEIDPALRNTDPVGVLPGEQGQPALPLILHYLITPYAPDPLNASGTRLALSGGFWLPSEKASTISATSTIIMPFR